MIITDCSFWQYGWEDQTYTKITRPIDFVKMREKAHGVIIRAGQNLWKDPAFSRAWTDAKAAGIPRGSYWFYDSRADPKKQAALWLAQLGVDRGEMMHFADFEDNYGGVYRYWQNYKDFLDEVKRLAPDLRLGIYTAFYFWRERLNGAPPSAFEYFKQYPLWIANYDVIAPLVPQPWKEWKFWQYTEKGDGKLYGVASASIDLNRYNGTIEQFTAEFGGVTPPEESNHMYEVTPIFTDGMNIRPQSNVNNSPIGKLAYDKTGKGDELWTAPADGTNVKKGDQWLKITEGGSAQGWVAITHMGKQYCTLKEVAPSPDPDPEPQPVPEVAVTVDTKLLTVTIHSDADMAVYFNGQKLK
jgi:GH25 family lysozyme M1 (1,4-beta-N-acetylmuramidase)